MKKIMHALACVLHTVNHDVASKTVNKLHWVLHASYLGAATLEGHGFYSLAAGGLLVVVVLGAVLGNHVE